VSAAACLLLYSFIAVVLAPRLLLRLAHTGVTPRLGVLAWVAALGSVVASWAAAAGFLLGEVVAGWNRPGRSLIGACFAQLRAVATGRYGFAIQLGVITLAAMTAVTLAVLLARLGRSLLRTRVGTHEHARMARIAGRRVEGLEAVVLDAPQRAAYCVPGRPHAIVITSAALAALDQRQLEAVLSHERAHLAGRHHLLLAVTRGLGAALPRLELFTAGATEVARLLEMCADDAAARRHGAPTVLRAMLALSSAAPIPRGALGATGVDVLARAERLAAPPRRVRRVRARLLLCGFAVLVALGPVVTGGLAAAGLSFCGPMNG
jgi:Zn-dependent protease with chaperone function